MAEISDRMYEQLRQILVKQNDRTYTFEEAKEIGNGLLDFYALLMELANDEQQAESSL